MNKVKNRVVTNVTLWQSVVFASRAAKMVYHNLKGIPVLLTVITTNTDSQSSPHQGHQVVQGLSLSPHPSHLNAVI